jgi:hypothetical protein
MLDIIDLEKRWFRYKLKTYLPYAIAGISAIIVVIVFLFWPTKVTKEKPTPKPQHIPQKKRPIKQAIKEPLEIKKKVQKIEQPQEQAQEKISQKIKEEPKEEKPMVFKPSFHFIQEIEERPSTPKKVVAKPKQKKEPAKKTHKELKIKKVKEVELAPEPKVEIVQDKEQIVAKKINIKRRNTQSDIQEIIKRFEKNNNPALSLFVAKKYYELGNYHQSYNYALITNRINSDIEQSWIIFAKSLVKLGKKDLAINTLKAYKKSSNSYTAEILLEDIQSGKFK